MIYILQFMIPTGSFPEFAIASILKEYADVKVLDKCPLEEFML